MRLEKNRWFAMICPCFNLCSMGHIAWSSNSKVGELNTTKVKGRIYVNSEFIFALAQKLSVGHVTMIHFCAEGSARSCVSPQRKNISCHLTMNL